MTPDTIIFQINIEASFFFADIPLLKDPILMEKLLTIKYNNYKETAKDVIKQKLESGELDLLLNMFEESSK